MDQVLHSDHLLLNSYTPGDQASFLSLVRDPEVMRFVGGPKESKDAAKLFERFASDLTNTSDRIWAIRLKDTNAYVGHAALFRSDVCRTDFEKEILFYLRKPFWKNGFGAEDGKLMMDYAFAEGGLKRIWATVDLEHEASRKVCEKIGMVKDRIGTDEQGDFLILRCESTSGLTR